MEKHKANTTARQQQQQQQEEQQQRQQEQEQQRQLEQQLEQQQQQQQELQQRLFLEHLQQGSSSSSPTPGDMSPIGAGIPVFVKNINANTEHNQQQPRYGSFTVETTEDGVPIEALGSGGGPKVSLSYANTLTYQHTLSHPNSPVSLFINT